MHLHLSVLPAKNILVLVVDPALTRDQHPYSTLSIDMGEGYHLKLSKIVFEA